MLDFVDETLNQMMLLIQMLVGFTLLFAVRAGWDHSFNSAPIQVFQQIVKIM
jgi:hypothetical protein